MEEETAAPQAEAPIAQPRSEDEHGASSAALVGLEKLGGWLVALLSRPRVRTTLVGVILILIGAFAVDGSVWTFPIVIVGIIMVIVAWVGSRLEGRFALEWGESGAGFEMSARFRSPEPARTALPSVSSTPVTSPSTATDLATVVPATQTEAPETIEGEAHTVEIDVEELRTLLAAAEKLARETSTGDDGTPVSWQGPRAA